MNLIFQIGTTAYLFLLVPFLLGVLEAVIFRKEKKGLSEIFTNGYLLMLALFFVLARVLIKMQKALSVLAKVWLFTVLLLSVLTLFLGKKRLAELLLEGKTFWSKKTAGGISQYGMLTVLLISVLVSIGFTKPDVSDATVSIVRISTETDSMYLYDAYSGYLAGAAEEVCVGSPIEMLYAVGVLLSGMDAAGLVYIVLPVSLLLFFFLGLWRMGKGFFTEKLHRIWFELIAVLFYWMPVFMQGRSLVMGIFLNSWNGLTLLSCVILPLMFSCCLAWMKEAERGIRKIPAKAEKLFTAVVLVFAGQLADSRGGFFVLWMLLLSLAVIFGKGGVSYGVASGRFKKRISRL